MKLENVKVGDLIALEERFGGGIALLKIERLTGTMAVCGNSRFRLDDGMVVGSGGGNRWDYRQYGRKATAADLINVRIRRASSRLKEFKVSKENLESVEALLLTTTGD